MKIIRNIEGMPWRRIGGWLPVVMLFCGALASCSSEDENGTSLPDGKYPLQLTAEVAQPQTRAGGKDTWTGGEEIRVEMKGVFGTKAYVMDAAGNAVPKDAANTFFWKNTAEDRISAWTPDLEAETDISDQTKGYAAFDVLYASAMGRYDQAVNLRFLHRMAKIEVTLKAGEGITEEELEGATVTIFGDPLTHSTGGLVSPGDQSDGEIKPYYDAATKKYEALVPPQDMTGKPLVRISIGGNAFTYTPDTEAAGKFDYFGGKRYAYTVTVKADGIDVRKVTGATWSAGGEENITSKRVKQRFTADELKIGDYFYSDGTWSDGGLRKIYADGSMGIDQYHKPAPLGGKTVVGIVFQTDKYRIGKKEKEKLGGEDKAHGLVMAIKNANSGETVMWRNESRYLDLLKDCVSKSDNYSDISGYGNCELIRSLEGNFDNYPALKAVDDYNTACPVPATTTGWYLPSSGQWWDILQNLGGCPALADGYQQTSSDIDNFFWSNQGNVPDALNKWMWGIDSWDGFSYYHKFWSSSKFKGSTMRYWVANSDDGWISCQWGNNNFQNHVRPVLAF